MILVVSNNFETVYQCPDLANLEKTITELDPKKFLILVPDTSGPVPRIIALAICFDRNIQKTLNKVKFHLEKTNG